MKQKCFEKCKSKNRSCQKKNCRYWMHSKEFLNCCIVGAKSSEKLTLQTIGEIFKVTRMRICQIEKVAVKKLKEKVDSVF